MAIEAYLDMVEKLNEASFKPLFARLYDWAFIDVESSKSDLASLPVVFVCQCADNIIWSLSDATISRKTVLYRVVDALVGRFKAIMTPYLSVIYDSTLTLLDEYSEGQTSEKELWSAIIKTLTTSFEADDGRKFLVGFTIAFLRILKLNIPFCLQCSGLATYTNESFPF